MRDAATDAIVPLEATHEVTGSELDLTLRAGETLGDRAFGTVQVQLVDADAKLASAWESLPGNFVRAPTISRIDCPVAPAEPCTLLGTNLNAIDGVADADGHFVPPDPGCTTAAKGTRMRPHPARRPRHAAARRCADDPAARGRVVRRAGAPRTEPAPSPSPSPSPTP